MEKKNEKKREERTAQRFTVDLHSETLSSFSFFLNYYIPRVTSIEFFFYNIIKSN
jgi:hypothetical protein